MLYVAAATREAGYKVQYFNASDRQYKDPLEDLPEAEVYGVTATILDVRGYHAVARAVRKRDRRLKLVVGGPLALTPGHLDPNLYDSALMGEGEKEFLRLLRDFPFVHRSYKAKRITDLDALPFPARDLVQGSLGGDVFAGGRRYYGEESTVICTSRGCPFDCTFCASPRLWGRRIIYRSPESVAAEIDEVVSKYGVRQLRFSDDNLTCNRVRLTALCEHLEGKEIAWRASIRVTPNDVPMFEMMKRAGCVEVSFGVESGDPDVLYSLRKKSNVKENRKAVLNAKSAGLDVRILFMIGTPGETTRTVNRNIEFLESVKDKYDTIAITNFTPLPGSEVAEAPDRCGCVILNRNIDHYGLCLYGPDGRNQWDNHVRPVGLTLEQLTENKERMVKYVLGTGKANEG
jgi:radical SAM superfamily enzyme YgiQ (UPF0313 family)